MDSPNVSSPVFPCILCGIFSLAIVSCYIDILHMTIQTLLLSYAADRELNDQTGMYVMTDRLKSFLTDEKSNPPFKGVETRFNREKMPQRRVHEGTRGAAFAKESQRREQNPAVMPAKNQSSKILV